MFHVGLYSVNQHNLYDIFIIDPTTPFIAINQRGSHLF